MTNGILEILIKTRERVIFSQCQRRHVTERSLLASATEIKNSIVNETELSGRIRKGTYTNCRFQFESRFPDYGIKFSEGKQLLLQVPGPLCLLNVPGSVRELRILFRSTCSACDALFAGREAAKVISRPSGCVWCRRRRRLLPGLWKSFALLCQTAVPGKFLCCRAYWKLSHKRLKEQKIQPY